MAAGVKPALRIPSLLVRAVATLAAVLAVQGGARAAGEREWQLAARTGTARVTADGRSAWGFAAALDLDYGLTDAWALRASLETSLHSVDKVSPQDGRPAGKIATGAALAGVTYEIDVLRLVPYGDLQLGAYRIGGAVTEPATKFVAALSIGADYFLSRRWTLGAYFQYLFAPFDLFSDPLSLGSAPYQFSATVRLSKIL
jgi:hypothetical protein